MAKKKVDEDKEITKKPGDKCVYSAFELEELEKCIYDPLYFIKNYVYALHSALGKVNIDLFPYQEEIITEFDKHDRICLSSSRQSGKCVYGNTIINYNGNDIAINSLIQLTYKEKLIEWLENLLFKLVK